MPLIKRFQIHEEGILYLQDHVPVAPSLLPEEEAAVTSLDLGSVRGQAEDILRRAHGEAARIQTAAAREAEELKERVRQEGREAGRQEGKREVSEKSQEVFEVLNEAVKERKKIVKDAEAEILRLSLKAAEQIIRSEVSLNRDVCLNIVSEAIGRVGDREQIIVRVNHEDVDYVKRYKDRIASMVDGVKSLSILEDSSVEPGGCVIETNLGFVDARINTKLKLLEEAFAKIG